MLELQKKGMIHAEKHWPYNKVVQQNQLQRRVHENYCQKATLALHAGSANIAS